MAYSQQSSPAQTGYLHPSIQTMIDFLATGGDAVRHRKFEFYKLQNALHRGPNIFQILVAA